MDHDCTEDYCGCEEFECPPLSIGQQLLGPAMGILLVLLIIVVFAGLSALLSDLSALLVGN